MKKLLIAASALAFCAQVHATDDGYRHSKKCRGSDLNGEWVAYQGTALAGQPHTGMCHLNIQDGTAEGTCDFSTGFLGPFQGQATVDENCAAEVTMDFAPAPFISTFHLQLHRDKQSFVGRWDNNFGAVGITNGVKR